MQDKNIWSFSDQNTLADINFFITTIALVIVDDLTLHLFGEWVIDRFDVFYSQRHIVVILDSVLNLATFLTNKLTASFASENWLEKVLAWRWFQSILNSVEKNIKEFLSVLLLSYVRRGSVKLFEWECKANRIVVVSFR